MMYIYILMCVYVCVLFPAMIATVVIDIGTINTQKRLPKDWHRYLFSIFGQETTNVLDIPFFFWYHYIAV